MKHTVDLVPIDNDIFTGYTLAQCSCDWASHYCPDAEQARVEAQTHLQRVLRPRYTAGYRSDGSVDFVKALTRPVIGQWEFPDWTQ